MCTCISYNRPKDWQTEPEVILETGRTDRPTICVDACIAPVIKHLWDNGIETLGCCCGHNVEIPSVILDEHMRGKEETVRYLIGEIDTREWRVLMWQLVEILR